jgi:hypothetical protein
MRAGLLVLACWLAGLGAAFASEKTVPATATPGVAAAFASGLRRAKESRRCEGMSKKIVRGR